MCEMRLLSREVMGSMECAVDVNATCDVLLLSFLGVFFLFFFVLIGRGRARTQVPTTRNYTLELPTFGVIAGVNPVEVQ